MFVMTQLLPTTVIEFSLLPYVDLDEVDVEDVYLALQGCREFSEGVGSVAIPDLIFGEFGISVHVVESGHDCGPDRSHFILAYPLSDDSEKELGRGLGRGSLHFLQQMAELRSTQWSAIKKLCRECMIPFQEPSILQPYDYDNY